MDFCDNGTWSLAYHFADREFPGDQGGDDEPCEEFEIGVKCLNQDCQNYIRIIKIISG